MRTQLLVMSRVKSQATLALFGLLVVGCGTSPAEPSQREEDESQGLGGGVVYLDCQAGTDPTMHLTLNEASGSITALAEGRQTSLVHQGTFGPETVTWSWPAGMYPDFSWKLNRTDLSFEVENHVSSSTEVGSCVLKEPGDRAF